MKVLLYTIYLTRVIASESVRNIQLTNLFLAPQSPQSVVEESYCIVFQLFEGLWQEKVGSIPKLPALIDSIKKTMQANLNGTRKILISDFKRTLSDLTTFAKKKPASVAEKFKQLCADLKKLKFETDQEDIINTLKGLELLIVSTTPTIPII